MGKFCDVRSVASSEPVKDDPGVTDDTQDLSVPVPFAQFTVPTFTVALFPTVIELGTGFAVVFEIVKLDTDGAKTNPDLVADPVSYPGRDAVTVAVTTPLAELIPDTVYVCPLDDPNEGDIVNPGTDAVHV